MCAKSDNITPWGAKKLTLFLLDCEPYIAPIIVKLRSLMDMSITHLSYFINFCQKVVKIVETTSILKLVKTIWHARCDSRFIRSCMPITSENRLCYAIITTVYSNDRLGWDGMELFIINYSTQQKFIFIQFDPFSDFVGKRIRSAFRNLVFVPFKRQFKQKRIKYKILKNVLAFYQRK